MIRHTADNAAYEAARAAMVPGASSGEATTLAQGILASQQIRDASIVIAPDPILESLAWPLAATKLATC